jgi:hypothetical protein
MSDETLRTSNNRAIWLGIAITLGPLAVMPWAARSPAYEQYRQPAQVAMQSADLPAAPAQIEGEPRN